MSRLEALTGELAEAAEHPGRVMAGYRERGKEVAGSFPMYVPEEIAHAAGLVPMGMWGGQVNPTHAGKYNPIFTCSIMRSCLEYGMTGVYRGMRFALMPMLCDTFRGMSAAWRAGVPEIPLVGFIHPQNRADPGAKSFLAEEYRSVKKRIEAILGREIREEDLERSIEVYNGHSAAMREFVRAASDHLDIVTPAVRHAVMKSGAFLEKSEHTEKVRELVGLLSERERHEWKGPKVVLTGITAEPGELLALFEENGIAVVGDDLAQESRLYRTDIPAGGDPLERLAEQWLRRGCCSTIHDAGTERGDMLVGMAKEKGADAVVTCLMRFCDVEEYDYPYMSRQAEEAGLRSVCLEIDQSTRNNEQSRTKIQSFAEMF